MPVPASCLRLPPWLPFMCILILGASISRSHPARMLSARHSSLQVLSKAEMQVTIHMKTVLSSGLDSLPECWLEVPSYGAWGNGRSFVPEATSEQLRLLRVGVCL